MVTHNYTKSAKPPAPTYLTDKNNVAKARPGCSSSRLSFR